MSNCVSFTPLVSFNPQTKPGVLISNCNARKVLWINNATRNSKIVKVLALESKHWLRHPELFNFGRPVKDMCGLIMIRDVVLGTKTTLAGEILKCYMIYIAFEATFCQLAINSGEKNKPNSIVCAQCDGNGAIVCSQCKGDGVNSVDHFNGQFKAGGLCWLCRGKREILCGNCNGAGFIGGFMSTFDE
ncbi:hypothetical protein LguiB_011581 [Lonicera macranthoides]